MRYQPSQRVVDLFATVESRAARLTEIVEEERTLRERLAELWREKMSVVANLADESRKASLTEVEEALKWQLKRRDEPHAVLLKTVTHD